MTEWQQFDSQLLAKIFFFLGEMPEIHWLKLLFWFQMYFFGFVFMVCVDDSQNIFSLWTLVGQMESESSQTQKGRFLLSDKTKH